MADARKVIQMTSAQRKRAESAIAETNAMLQGLWSGVRFAKGPKVYGLPKGATKLLGERLEEVEAASVISKPDLDRAVISTLDEVDHGYGSFPSAVRSASFWVMYATVPR